MKPMKGTARSVHPTFILLTALLLTALLLAGCTSLNLPSKTTLNRRNRLRAGLQPISSPWVPAQGPAAETMAPLWKGVEGTAYYGLTFPMPPDAGLPQPGARMAAHIIYPERVTRGTVILIHGYAGNPLGLRNLCRTLLNHGFCTALLALPGHSLSEGPRGDIGTFRDYSRFLRAFREAAGDRLPAPFSAVGHSTGAASLLEYGYHEGWDFRRVVLVSPLIRSYAWQPSRFGRFLTRPFLRRVNAPWEGPLAVQTVPLHWFDQLNRWNKALKSRHPLPYRALLLQGTADRVVSWKYNIPFLEKKLAKTKTVLIEGLTHDGYVDSPPVRKQLIAWSAGWLLAGSPPGSVQPFDDPRAPRENPLTGEAKSIDLEG